MAQSGPTIPDDKLDYFQHLLMTELSHMFEWEGLPETVPGFYIEWHLVRNGKVMFYKNPDIGLDVLEAQAWGYNRHGQPTQARTFTPTTNQEVAPHIERNIKYLSTNDEINKLFDEDQDAVIIQNMDYGRTCWWIVNHYATRLAIAQQALDTNLMYMNMPYIFATSTDDTRLSIEKMFRQIYEGKPFIVTDKHLLEENGEVTGKPTDIPFIADQIQDTKNEIMMEFRETVGIKTAGVDKAERVNTEEVTSNSQHNKTMLRVMLEQRKNAVEAINAFFETNISVNEVQPDEPQGQAQDDGQGGEEDGTGHDGVEARDEPQ